MHRSICNSYKELWWEKVCICKLYNLILYLNKFSYGKPRWPCIFLVGSVFCSVIFFFPFSNGKYLEIFLMHSRGSSYRNGNSFWLCASKQEMDRRAVPLTSGKGGVAGIFFSLLPLLGIHKFSASCSFLLNNLASWGSTHHIERSGEEELCCSSQTSDSSVLSDCDWWKGSIKLSEGRKTMTSI